MIKLHLLIQVFAAVEEVVIPLVYFVCGYPVFHVTNWVESLTLIFLLLSMVSQVRSCVVFYVNEEVSYISSQMLISVALLLCAVIFVDNKWMYIMEICSQLAIIGFTLLELRYRQLRS